MINANELRIGNWFNFKNPMDGKLSPTQFTIWGDYLDFEAYGQPIQLTPEILLGCGFEKLKGTKHVYAIHRYSNLEISVSVELHFAYIDTKWGQASIKNPIFKYLHQIQNIYFSLMGEELIINFGSMNRTLAT